MPVTVPVLVEVAGIDGSGKSSLLDQVEGWLQAGGVPVFRRSFKSGARRLVRRAGGFGQEAVEAVTAVEMLQAAGLTLQPVGSVDAGPPEVFLTDEFAIAGLARGLMRLGRRHAGIEALYRRLPVPTVALHLDVPVELAVRRLAGRPRGDKSLLVEPAAYLREFCRWQRIARDALSYPVVRIDASQPPDRVWAEARIALDPLSVAHPQSVEKKGGAGHSV